MEHPQLAFITWDVNPEIFHYGSFAIRWYGLLFATGFAIGYYIMLKFFKKEKVDVKLLDKLTTYMVIATIVGARLGHCLFYEPSYYLQHPLEILEVWKGGLASHGAALGILIALYIFHRKTKLSYWWVLDRIAVVTALAGFFIRMGNLMNSEIYGKVTSLPWGFYFVRASEHADSLQPRHPTEIYEALAYLAIFIFLLYYYYHKNGKPAPALLISFFLVFVFTARFIIEFLKVPQVGFERGMALDLGQWLSIPFILAGLAGIYFITKKQARLTKKN